MRTVMNRLTASALAVGALCLGLAFPGTASADQVDAVQLQVCNNNPRLMTFFVGSPAGRRTGLALPSCTKRAMAP